MNNSLKKLALAVGLATSLGMAMTPVYAANDSEIKQLFEKVNIEHAKFTLENGLTTIVLPDHSKPEVRVEVRYNVGSKDDPADKTGLAHLFEHLVFGGTENAPGFFFKQLTDLGGSNFNATTSTDMTNYFETVPTGSIDRILWLEGDRMANIMTGITEQEVIDEIEVVKNEKRQRESGPDSFLQSFFAENFYPAGHPYSHPVLGHMEHIESYTRADMEKWFADKYGASNAVLILAGDITVEQAKEKVAKYFSDVPTGTPNNKIENYLPVFNEIKRVETYSQATPATQVTRSWPIPHSADKEMILLNALAPALAQHPESVLVKKLKDELEYVSSISFTPYGMALGGYANLQYYVRDEAGVSIEAINKVIDEELEKFFKKGPDMDILRREMLKGDASFIRGVDATGIAGAYGILQVTAGDPEFWKTTREWERAASQKDLAEVAKKWLGKPYLETIVHAKPQIEDMVVKVDRSTMPEIKETKAKIEFPEFQQATLDNGLEIVLIEDNSVPVIDFNFEIFGGRAAQNKYGFNSASILARQLTNGNDEYDKDELNVEMENMTMLFRAMAVPEATIINLNTLTPYLSDALELTAETIMNPTVPDKYLKPIRENADKRIKAMAESPMATQGKLFNQLIFGKNHELGQLVTLEQSIAGAQRDNLMQLHKDQYGPNNARVWITGNISLEQAVKKLNKYFGDWKPVKEKVGRVKLSEIKPMTGKVVLIDSPGAQTTNLTLGLATEKFDPKNDEIGNMMNAIIGGDFQSRINLNIREDKGWSYGTRSSLLTTAEDVPGRFMVNTSVQTDKTAETIQELLKEFNAYISNKPATQSELDKVRDAAIKSAPSIYGTNDSYIQAASTSLEYGLPLDYNEKSVERLEAVTLKQVHDYAKKIIKPENFVYLIIGDTAQYEQKLRDLKIGDVEVWDALGNKLR